MDHELLELHRSSSNGSISSAYVNWSLQSHADETEVPSNVESVDLGRSSSRISLVPVNHIPRSQSPSTGPVEGSNRGIKAPTPGYVAVPRVSATSSLIADKDGEVEKGKKD